MIQVKEGLRYQLLKPINKDKRSIKFLHYTLNISQRNRENIEHMNKVVILIKYLIGIIDV